MSGIEDGYGRASEFEPTEHLSVKEARRSDRFTQFALAASKEALEDAGWEDGPPETPTARPASSAPASVESGRSRASTS